MIDILKYKKDNIDKLFKRITLNDDDKNKKVRAIVDDVRNNKDSALFKYINMYDKLDVNADNIIVTEDEIDKAIATIDSKLIDTLNVIKENVLDYHKKQLTHSMISIKGDSKVGWINKPVNRAAIYVPGGKAAYPSTVLMTALPALAANVREIVIATPNLMPLTLLAARISGVSKIYKMGGAHAIAAFAYGTESVKKADVIVGPGNSYVTIAKKLVYGDVNIDMIAGPSEILIIADDSAKASYVAADLLSQAEHDEEAASILITTSEKLAYEVKSELSSQTALLSRSQIISQSIKNNSAIVLVDSLTEAMELSNSIAPEHLEICTYNAEELALSVENAGAIFIGNYSPEPLGDYYAGPSHTLPTSGSSRYFSVLNVDTFIKKISYINYSREDLIKASGDIIRLAEAEGFTAHANSIKVREDK